MAIRALEGKVMDIQRLQVEVQSRPAFTSSLLPVLLYIILLYLTVLRYFDASVFLHLIFF